MPMHWQTADILVQLHAEYKKNSQYTYAIHSAHEKFTYFRQPAKLTTSNDQPQLHPTAEANISHTLLLDFPPGGLSDRCEGHGSKAFSAKI
jgi:hypothetical protein